MNFIDEINELFKEARPGEAIYIQTEDPDMIAICEEVIKMQESARQVIILTDTGEHPSINEIIKQYHGGVIIIDTEKIREKKREEFIIEAPPVINYELSTSVIERNIRYDRRQQNKYRARNHKR